ncbi:MAG TPA: cysteine hydrolase [Candidatus Brachybacterium merdavium]|uniref:Cysteine hydrolase n=1 Tax=Candidatus Brachybacterium merdavium TaxID=2838513 RepID=A0A9D2LFL0_9MICO|nr:cysteine hydrolase [Candidatus Brachybacterium merdavium]
MTSTSDDRPWLLVVDPQRIFADPASDWASSFFPAAMTQIRRLATHVGPERTLVTRWLPTADRSTAWGDYFRAWPFADVPASHPLYELVDEARELSAHPTIDEPTFGKWGPQLAEIVGPHPHLLLTGVSTDCCVITTALAAADAGARLSVVQDACAASTAADGAAAMQIMGLFPPQIDVTSSAEVLRAGSGREEPRSTR